jgi:hypothetical protein
MRARRSWLIGVAFFVGCAHRPTPRVEGSPPPQPPKARVKLAVLPVDEEQALGPVAKGVNRAFRDVKVAGVDDYFMSKVALEVVQLSIECVQPTSACYVAVGKSLSANKLLLGQVVAIGKKKRDKSVRVTVTLFDVDLGEAVNVVDHVYKTPELAAEGAAEVVAEATGEPPKLYGPDRERRSGAGAGGGTMARGRKP